MDPVGSAVAAAGMGIASPGLAPLCDRAKDVKTSRYDGEIVSAWSAADLAARAARTCRVLGESL